MRLRAMVVTFGLLASVSVPGTSRADDPVMPQELVDDARARGCRPVTDFASRPGVVGPSFVYGYAPGPEHESAAYWCETGPKERPAFRLMLMFKDGRQELARCPHHIEWGDRIGGLSIEKDETGTLDGFVPLNYRAPRPSKGAQPTHPMIRSQRDGAGAVFYCQAGTWYVRMQD